MNYETILFTKKEGVATITLNRPDVMNTLNNKMVDELIAATQDAGDDDTVKAVVLTGAGKAFCAGADLQSSLLSVTNPIEMRKLIAVVGKIPLNLRNMEKPVIAGINGVAVGAGLGFAIAADIILASDKARFGHVYRNIGVMSDAAALYFLPRLIGVSRACDLVFTGKVIDAAEAERIGLVNKVVPADQLEKEVQELALKLAKGPSAVIGMAKTTIYQGLLMDLATCVEWEARAMSLCLLAEDKEEGIKAFKEKRQPLFKGR